MDLGVSKNNGIPKSSILIGFSIINHPFWVPVLLETPIFVKRKHQKNTETSSFFDGSLSCQDEVGKAKQSGVQVEKWDGWVSHQRQNCWNFGPNN